MYECLKGNMVISIMTAICTHSNSGKGYFILFSLLTLPAFQCLYTQVPFLSQSKQP